MLFLTLKSIHIFMIASWFGLVVILDVIWRKAEYLQDDSIQALTLWMVKRLEFFIGLLVLTTGLILIGYDSSFLTFGWLHVKLTIWVIVFGLGHVVRSKLEKVSKKGATGRAYIYFNWFILAGLIGAIVMVELKPF